jgi:hypothetical protein
MSETTLDALRSTLAAEHVAVYSYGVLGARTSRSAEPALAVDLEAAYVAHRGRRDVLVRAIRDLGVEPDAAAPAYDVTRDLGTPARVAAVALGLERGTAATYADLVSATVDLQRRWAIEALNDAAARELRFGGHPEVFPGLAEFADR